MAINYEWLPDASLTEGGTGGFVYGSYLGYETAIMRTQKWNGSAFDYKFVTLSYSADTLTQTDITGILPSATADSVVAINKDYEAIRIEAGANNIVGYSGSAGGSFTQISSTAIPNSIDSRACFCTSYSEDLSVIAIVSENYDFRIFEGSPSAGYSQAYTIAKGTLTAFLSTKAPLGISADGNTVAAMLNIGDGVSRMHIFTRTGGSWSAYLDFDSGNTPNAHASASVSRDGSMVSSINQVTNTSILYSKAANWLNTVTVSITAAYPSEFAGCHSSEGSVYARTNYDNTAGPYSVTLWDSSGGNSTPVAMASSTSNMIGSISSADGDLILFGGTGTTYNVLRLPDIKTVGFVPPEPNFWTNFQNARER